MAHSHTKRRYNSATGPSPERGKMLCDRVYSFYEPEGEPEVEIVFIHGLSKLRSGDLKDAYWTTWLAKDGSEDNCWPKTWLAAKFPKARILSVSYDAERALKSSTSGTMDLYPVAESLVQEMVFTGVGLGQHGCPVVFVCHCLGGLIAKQIVVMGHTKFKEDRRVEKLLCNTKAFVFYATPHGGSEVVEMVPEIGRLNSEFESIQRKAFNNRWKFVVVAESHATTIYKFLYSSMIVEEHSARHVGYDHVMHVAADHFDVCRPESETSTNYLSLAECIADVVDDHERETQYKIMELPSKLVGVDAKQSMLCEKLRGCFVIGLVGVGGIGKTTLSKFMYNSQGEYYERRSYLEDVKSHGNIADFQKQLLRELCDEKWNVNKDVKYHLRKIEDHIKKKKVLVVIDDVGTGKNLRELQVLDAFKNGKSGSKLVITCRDRAILRDYMSEREIVEVRELNDDDSMQLFSHYAFHKFDAAYEMESEDRSKFEDQAVEIVKACGGLPLSLEVIGQHLRKQNYRPEDDRMEMWKEALKRLKAADALEGHENADEKLWAKLRISYDELGKLEKELFLDFACIFCNMEDVAKNTIARIWSSIGGLQTLIDSSLIKVVTVGFVHESSDFRLHDYFAYKDKLVMHDQLRDFGRRIVRDKANKDIRKYKHMWNETDIGEVLERRKGSKTLEGLSLTGVKILWPSESQISQAIKNDIVRSLGYPQLRLLNLSSIGSEILDYALKKCQVKPGQMSWLCLNGTEVMEKHLASLDGRFTRLNVLHLRNCQDLRELPSSIGDLTSLKELDLGWCRNLKSLPDAIGNLVQLLELGLFLCDRLERLPTTMGGLKQLKFLDLSWCEVLEEIPTSVGQLTKLEFLSLAWCLSLHTMCEFETRMPHLSKLDLFNCRSLTRFESLGNLYRLQALEMSGCFRLWVPNLAECLGQMTQLQYLNLKGCGRMAEEAGTLWKGHFCTRTPLPVLEVLYLSAFSNSTRLPLCPRLKSLELSYDGPYHNVEVEDEELLEFFGESLGNHMHLQVLRMDNFRMHDFPIIPESLGNLTQLRELYFWGIMNLPDSVSKLVELKILSVSNLYSNRLPEHLGSLASLQKLKVKFSDELVELPLSVGHLSQLRSLNLRGCSRLERLPECLAGLPQLSKLILLDCHSLMWMEEGQYAILRRLHERGCKITLASGSEFRR